MQKVEFKQIDLHLEHEINRLSQSAYVAYRDAVREDGRQVISDLKSDIELWVNALSRREIACYDIENLLNSKRSVVKLSRLKNKGIESSQLQNYTDDILRLIAKAIMNTYLDSLFKSKDLMLAGDDNLYEN